MEISRRSFIQKGASLGLASIVAPSFTRAQNMRGQKLRVAVIGVGGRGNAHIRGLKNQEFVAFCDVDDKRAAKAFKEHPNVPRFKDYRVMFDKMGSQFEAVSIAVPDHMHYSIAMLAIANGKHVFCEKPLVRTFEEAMLLKKAAKESGVITQMGNQGHANNGLRDVQEWIEAGLIGDVKHVHHWTNRPVWPQGMQTWPSAEPTPSTLDWDLWLGVAPAREYSSKIAPFNWRGFKDYGAGAIGDIACHAMDASYTPLKLGFPSKVRAELKDRSEITFPKESTIHYQFPAIPGRDTVNLTWMDGGLRPLDVPFVPHEFIHANKEKNKKGIASGGIIVGSKASIFTDMYAKAGRIFPFDYFRQLRMDEAMPEETLPRVKGGHFKEWVEGIKAGKQPGGNIVDYAADFTGTALIGAASLSVEGTLEFDSKSSTFTNNPAANSLLKSQYDYRKEFMA